MWILRITDPSHQKIPGPSCPNRHHDFQVAVSCKSGPTTSLPIAGVIPMCPFCKTPAPTATLPSQVCLQALGPLATIGCPSRAALRSRVWIVIHNWRALSLSKRCDPFPLKDREKENGTGPLEGSESPLPTSLKECPQSMNNYQSYTGWEANTGKLFEQNSLVLRSRFLYFAPDLAHQSPQAHFLNWKYKILTRKRSSSPTLRERLRARERRDLAWTHPDGEG